jgi:uncharacterized protein (DUF4415 family)
LTESTKTKNADKRSGWLAAFYYCSLLTPTGALKVMNESAFSRRGRRRREKAKSMKKISKKQARELATLARIPDDEIDLTDAPEIRDWRDAVVGKFYRPIKTPVTIRVDADVLAWLKRQGRGYQTRINKLLRDAMEAKPRTRAR